MATAFADYKTLDRAAKASRINAFQRENERAAKAAFPNDVYRQGVMEATAWLLLLHSIALSGAEIAEAILLCESDGTAEEVDEEIAHMTDVLKASGATAIAVSQDEAERLKFWSGRKNAFPAAGRISPDYYCMDGTIPRKHLAQVLLGIADMEKTYGLRCANVFHAGDGNLHPLILFDANTPGEFDRAEKFGAAILELCVEVGGTITGEHGVGIEKINSMCVQFSAAEREAFFGVKRAFDTAFLLNPDKAIPTLHRCAEYGKMHVRQGQLKFADLPRF